MEIENIIEKITQQRSKKGYTYENMTQELDITSAAYREIETGETRLTVDRLFKISKILDIPLSDLLEIGNDVFQQNNNETATGYQQKIEHFYQDNKEIYEKHIKSQEEEIQFLRNLVDKKTQRVNP